MAKKLLLFFFLTLVVLSCTRCKEECTDSTNPDCPNYVAPPTPVDPCAGSSEVSAEFSISQKCQPFSPNPYYIETLGAVCAPFDYAGTTNIRLYALQEGHSYKWIVGTDTIYNREYEFQFGEEFAGSSYPIKLIVNGTPDSTCFPFDNGMDTVVKMLPVIKFYDNPIFGTYRVAFDTAPLDSFLVRLSVQQIQSGEYQVFAHNFSNLGSLEDACPMTVRGFSFGYLDIITGNSIADNCRKVRGAFQLKPNDVFEAAYQMEGETPGVMISRRIKGRRIN